MPDFPPVHLSFDWRALPGDLDRMLNALSAGGATSVGIGVQSEVVAWCGATKRIVSARQVARPELESVVSRVGIARGQLMTGWLGVRRPDGSWWDALNGADTGYRLFYAPVGGRFKFSVGFVPVLLPKDGFPADGRLAWIGFKKAETGAPERIEEGGDA